MSSSNVNITFTQGEFDLPQHPPPLPYEPAPLKASSCAPVSLAPFPRDINFVGRNLALDLIDKMSQEQPCIAISGTGGVGPSEKWLLVLDNADDASMYYGSRANVISKGGSASKAYIRYLPNGTSCSMLVTTRDRRVGEWLTNRQLSLGNDNGILPMSLTEAVILPLAITQAVAFICENNITVSEYLETMRASDNGAKELLSQHLEDSRRDLDSENSVMRSWKLAYDYLSRNVPRAAEMLSLLSTFDYHGVPLVLLQKRK
ncbi:hypothetical protein F5Y03DRAFT_396709 [Xylaria venustula]|nr:hypothetical protein F5Y03DRAFT_396709 [Xylaria venustula]